MLHLARGYGLNDWITMGYRIVGMDIQLDWRDVTILGAYLVSLAAIGIFFSKRQHKLEDFFLARRGMSWLPVGLSLMAALNSGIDYLGQPSFTIKFGLVVLVGNLSWFVLYPYVFFVTLPLFRRLDVYSAYEYLERRFNLGVRGLGAMIFILWRLSWMATALYVPCLAITSVIGRPDLLVPMIVTLGALVTFYTMLGGIKAVIWTDVLQFCIMGAGLAATVIVAWYHVPGGWSEIASSAGKLGADQARAAIPTSPGLGAIHCALLRRSHLRHGFVHRDRCRPVGHVHQRSGHDPAIPDDAFDRRGPQGVLDHRDQRHHLDGGVGAGRRGAVRVLPTRAAARVRRGRHGPGPFRIS